MQGLDAGVPPERASAFMVATWWISVSRRMGRGLDGTPTFRVQTPPLVSRSSFTEDMVHSSVRGHIYAFTGGVMQILSFLVPGFITGPGIFLNKFVLVIRLNIQHSSIKAKCKVSGRGKPRPEIRDLEDICWILPGTRC